MCLMLKNKQIQKIISVFLLSATVLLIIAIAISAQKNPAPMELKGIDYRYSSVSSTLDSRFYYSDYMLLEDSKVFSSSLTNASVSLAMLSYSKSDINDVLEQMGFLNRNDYGSYDKTSNLSYDDNNYVAFTVAEKEVSYNGSDYIIYCVPIKGTSKNPEWFSNFDLGEGADHDGFYASAAEVSNQLSKVFSADGYSKSQRIIWFTGHSRGAAVANILAGQMTDSQIYAETGHIFGYTFACPSVSKNADVSYTNIYNFNNSGDLIPLLPMADWDYKRYGQTVSLSDLDYSNFIEQFKTNKGEIYAAAQNGDSYSNLLLSIVKSQEDYNEPLTRGAMDLAAYFLAGKPDEISPLEILSNTGVNIAETYIRDLFSNASDTLYLIFNTESEYQNLYQYYNLIYQASINLADKSQEEFDSWLLAESSAIYEISKITGIRIQTFADLSPAQSILISTISTVDSVAKFIGNLISVFLDTNGNPMTAVTHGHEPATYVLWINSMYNGYKGHYNDKSLVSINIDTNIVGDYCFDGCSQLSEVNFSDDVSVICKNSFSGCTDLLEITIPDSVVSVGNYAFNNCTGLKELTMPVDLNYSADYNASSFRECTGIKSIHYTFGKTGIMTDFKDTDYSAPYIANQSLTSVTFDSGITHIGDYAFEGCYYLESAVLSPDIKSIGNYAFSGCLNLKTANLPDTLLSIGDYAFSECQTLALDDIPQSLENIGTAAFSNCDGLIKATIPESVTVINDLCFAHCDNLQEVTIPDSVVSVGNYAFNNCTGLKELTMPVDLNYSADYNASSFRECTGIKSIHYTFGKTGIMTDFKDTDYSAPYIANQSLTSVTFDSGITHIGDYAFEGCYYLESAVLSPDIKSIGNYAFSGCLNLKTANLPDTLLSIGNYAFSECQTLALDDIPQSLENIGTAAFSNCDGLIKATIPESVTVINDLCFAHCDNLQEVIIPDSVTFIGNHTFHNCYNVLFTVLTGSYAHNYVADNNFNYTPDITGDNFSNILDLIKLRKFMLEHTEGYESNYDVNLDNTVNSLDFTFLKRKLFEIF